MANSVVNIGQLPNGTAATVLGVNASGAAVQVPVGSMVQSANNLSDLADKAAARANLGLGAAAQLDASSGAGASATASQVVKGDDPRMSDARTPAAHSHPASQISDAGAAGKALLAAATTAAALTALGLPSGSALGFRNRIINGDFRVNQRAVSGTVTLAAGAYGHDRWKAGASGCTYTFATSANVTTLTITAGSLMQVIEGINLRSGTHVLTWTGTATARIDSGSYGSSGITGNATGGTNQTIEFGTGTVASVQYELGNVATPVEFRPINIELQLCQRYYWRKNALYEHFGPGSGTAAGQAVGTIAFPVPMRASPTLSCNSPVSGNFNLMGGGGGALNVTNLVFANASVNSTWWTATVDTAYMVGGQGTFLWSNSATAFISASAEL